MYVIGTAGHVDHGKSTLIQALTGIDPDRLAEEKERALTIDLGFAWMTLGGEDEAGEEGEIEVGVVDVPGHRDFIENMLAGVGGIDLALFVVAADEGVMPQTREHLAIIDLLQIPRGVAALTKVDLIDDAEWLELVELDLADTLAGTVLEDAPILPVSGRTGAGLEALRRTLWRTLRQSPPRPDNGRPRLPVDRVFTLPGFGVIVTGTLIDGRFQVGDTVQLQPGGQEGRIRGLQTHKTKRDVAHPGSRVAVNLSGVDKDQIQRGHVLTKPGVLSETILFDAAYRHLPDAVAPLTHNMEVKLFIGAAEVLARARLLGAERLSPGAAGWLQLATQEPVAVARGDRFILRRPSPGATLGGGRVLDPHPGRRHRRFRAEVVERLRVLAEGAPEDVLLQRLRRMEPASRRQLLAAAGMDRKTAVPTLEALIAAGAIIPIDDQLVSRAGWEATHDKMRRILRRYHQETPLRLGMPREEARSRLGLAQSLFNALLAEAIAAETAVLSENGILRLPGHAIRFTPRQEDAIADLRRRLAAAGVNSPSVKEVKRLVGEDVYQGLVDLGELRPLSGDVVYGAAAYEQLVARITAHLQKRERTDVAQVRDLLDTSRKYAIALLEHLDDIGVTRRVGDERVLKV
jgi:selenocysteine-specific elongation factor